MRNRPLGLIAAFLFLAVTLFCAGVTWFFLTDKSDLRLTLVGIILFIGLAFSVAAYILVSRTCTNLLNTAIVILVLAILLVGPPASMIYPGTITHSRLGLTVYGVIPVPWLDITVGPRGGLWFRKKSDVITEEEVRALISPEVEVVVIGTGWHSHAAVEEGVKKIKGPEIRILGTPEAFDAFNELKAQKRVVALIAQTSR